MLDQPPRPRSIAGAPSGEAIYQPSPVYLTGEESLRLSSIGNASGVTLTARGILLRPGDDLTPMEFTHAPNSNRTLKSTDVSLSEGWLLGVTVKATAGTPAFGGVWVLVELVRGLGAAAVVVRPLGYGFVTALQPYQWPNGENYLATDGPGCLRVITGSTPSAGAEITETVPTGARWELLALGAVLTASAVVTSRIPALALDDGATEFFRYQIAYNATASAVWRYQWAQGNGDGQPFGSLNIRGLIPIGIRLGAGFRVKTITQNLDVGDQWSSPKFLVREWFDV